MTTDIPEVQPTILHFEGTDPSLPPINVKASEVEPLVDIEIGEVQPTEVGKFYNEVTIFEKVHIPKQLLAEIERKAAVDALKKIQYHCPTCHGSGIAPTPEPDTKGGRHNAPTLVGEVDKPVQIDKFNIVFDETGDFFENGLPTPSRGVRVEVVYSDKTANVLEGKRTETESLLIRLINTKLTALIEAERIAGGDDVQ